jgi:hypothetical protein
MRGLAKAIADLPVLVRPAGAALRSPYYAVELLNLTRPDGTVEAGEPLYIWARTPQFVPVVAEQVKGWSRVAAAASVIASLMVVLVVVLRSRKTIPSKPGMDKRAGYETNVVNGLLFSESRGWRTPHLFLSLAAMAAYLYCPPFYQEVLDFPELDVRWILFGFAAISLLACRVVHKGDGRQMQPTKWPMWIALATAIAPLSVLLAFTFQYTLIGLVVDPGNAINPIARGILGIAYGFVVLRTTSRNGWVRLVGENPWCQLVLRARYMLQEERKVSLWLWGPQYSRFWDRRRVKAQPNNPLVTSEIYSPLFPSPKVAFDPEKYAVHDKFVHDSARFMLGLLGPSIYPLYLEPIAWLLFFITLKSFTDNVETFESKIWELTLTVSVITIRFWPTLGPLLADEQVVGECREAMFRLLMVFNDVAEEQEIVAGENEYIVDFKRISDRHRAQAVRHAAEILAQPGKGVLYDFQLHDKT